MAAFRHGESILNHLRQLARLVSNIPNRRFNRARPTATPTAPPGRPPPSAFPHSVAQFGLCVALQDPAHRLARAAGFNSAALPADDQHMHMIRHHRCSQDHPFPFRRDADQRIRHDGRLGRRQPNGRPLLNSAGPFASVRIVCSIRRPRLIMLRAESTLRTERIRNVAAVVPRQPRPIRRPSNE